MAHPQIDTARLLSAIVDSSDDAIVSKDLNGIVTSWNRSAEKMFGWTADEMIGQSIRRIIPQTRMHEEDHVLASIRQGDRVDHFETERQHKNGTFVSISLTVSPIRDASGKVVGASKIARDISEGVRARRREVFLSEVTSVLAASLDYEKSLKTLSALAVPEIADWCAIDLVGENDEIVRIAVSHVNPDKVQVAEVVRSRYSSQDSPFGARGVVTTRKAALIPTITDEMIVESAKGDAERMTIVRSLGLVSYLIVPIVAHDRPLGALALATAESGRRYSDSDLRFAEEIAARAGLAIENAKAYKEMEGANRLKDEFLATLSHELRTPLNAVMGYARLLKAGAITAEKAPQAFDVIDRNAASLAQIVEDVLDVSRIISGKTRLEVQPLDLSKLIQDALASVTPAIEAKGLRLQVLLDSRVGPVSGDPDRLQQVLWNLLSNAAKFTPSGGRIQVRLERVNSHVEIIVSDTGIGISESFLPHIFERFRQAEGGTTRRHGGLGLGLAIARHLLEMHGGTIHAASDGEGKGATFRVKLPLLIVHAEPHIGSPREHPHAPAPLPLQHEMADLTGISVLAVDDDVDALQLLSDILETAGASVTTVNSAESALEKLQSERPMVLVSDLGMPGTDGFDLIKRIRKLDDPELRVIPAAALTAYARSGDRAKSMRSGFEMHLAKPIDPTELIAAVGALARRHVKADH
jgi:PAS domain S-box-containing protein